MVLIWWAVSKCFWWPPDLSFAAKCLKFALQLAFQRTFVHFAHTELKLSNIFGDYSAIAVEPFLHQNSYLHTIYSIGQDSNWTNSCFWEEELLNYSRRFHDLLYHHKVRFVLPSGKLREIWNHKYVICFTWNVNIAECDQHSTSKGPPAGLCFWRLLFLHFV